MQVYREELVERIGRAITSDRSVQPLPGLHLYRHSTPLERVYSVVNPSVCGGTREQLLRVLASDSMRHALEQHYGVKLAFQNCHRVALFRTDQLDATYDEFISPRSQLLNQSPELRDC